MKIAVVGAGVSGLVAAHLLARRHDVTVFEANAYAGGHTHTHTVVTESGEHRVDTGFMVYNDRNYPNFERLLAQLGVGTQPSNMSFSVHGDNPEFEYAGHSPNALFAQRRHAVTPRFLGMLADVRRFQRAARALLRDGSEPGPSLGEWLEQQRFGEAFVERVIVPQASAVWSADPRQMWSFPARFLAAFFDNHGLLHLHGRPCWRSVSGGARSYVERIVAPFGARRLRLATPIQTIRRNEDAVEVAPRGGEPERFDHVVVGAHADQALRMLGDASEREHEVLGAFPYQPNDAVLHSDRSLLPRRRRAWASWNYHLLDAPTGRTTVTYHLNRLQDLRADRELCVSLNMSDAIDPDQVIARMTYDHPVYTQAGMDAQRRWEEVSGVRRTWFCGAYWGWGFHEDGVVSALRVAERLGCRL